jgi:MscS family membrane protein
MLNSEANGSRNMRGLDYSAATLPSFVQELSTQDLSWWQWLLLPLLAGAAWIVALSLSRVTRALIAHVTRRTKSWDAAQLDLLAGPFTLGWAVALLSPALRWLRLDRDARDGLHSVMHAVGLLAFFWGLARSIDVLRQLISNSSWGRLHSATRSLLPLGVKVGKVVVVALGLVALLSEFGYPVTSLVAGLGIGGVAVALGAQKTLENLFGALAIGTDQPFLVGDYVRVGDIQGNVENTGLRSTRIRTPDRTLITIPNGKLADLQIESFAVRDRLRFNCRVALVYGTRAEQLRAILDGFEAVLREQPKLWPSDMSVRFVGFGESSLNIDINAVFATTDYDEFSLVRQDTLLRFMHVVERAGSAFAFPTRTVHIRHEQGASDTQEAIATEKSAAAPNQ